jgi:hypothetical protein
MGGHRGLIAGFVGLVVVAAGVVSGCSSGAQGASGPDVGVRVSSSSPAVGVSGSPGKDVSERSMIPPGARAATVAGAEAYFRFYVDTLNAGFTDPGSVGFAGLSEPGCVSCANLEKSIGELRGRHEHVSTAPYVVSASAELPESTRKNRAFQFLLTENASSVVDDHGVSVKSQPAAAHVMEVLLSWADDGWRVRDLALATEADR